MPIEDILGASEAMKRIRREIAGVAPLDSSVLITGETGVGKSLLARVLHRNSGRCGRPFVHIDCSTLAPSVIESELFGHERGAFTGAQMTRPGRFEVAGEGTVFLDEIGDLELPLQTKLRRVLEEREFERVGGRRTRTLRARVIAATNRDLEAAVREGCFRADLFFRLDVIRMHIPALRERPEDVPVLAEAILEQIADRLCLPVPDLPAGFLECLSRRTWPGNVRELRNALERVTAHHHADLEPEDIELVGPVAFTSPSPNGELDAQSEDEQIRAVLLEVGGNVSRAARRLGKPRSTLRYKIEQLRLGNLIPHD